MIRPRLLAGLRFFGGFGFLHAPPALFILEQSFVGLLKRMVAGVVLSTPKPRRRLESAVSSRYG
jgi:hypothetical protein